MAGDGKGFSTVFRIDRIENIKKFRYRIKIDLMKGNFVNGIDMWVRSQGEKKEGEGMI